MEGKICVILIDLAREEGRFQQVIYYTAEDETWLFNLEKIKEM